MTDVGRFVPVPRPDAGTVVVAVIDGVPVAIADVDGTIHAFDDTCTHRECPLSEGQIDGDTVVCPCHKSRFDLRSGRPLNGPATLPLRIRATRVDGDRVDVEA